MNAKLAAAMPQDSAVSQFNDDAVRFHESEMNKLAIISEKIHNLTNKHHGQIKKQHASAFGARRAQVLYEAELMANKANENNQEVQMMAAEAIKLADDNNNAADNFKNRNDTPNRPVVRKRELGVKRPRKRAYTTVCVYCSKTFTHNDECRRHLREKEYPIRYPLLDRPQRIKKAAEDAP